MKQVVKLFGLQEQTLLTEAWLTSSGVSTETQMVTFRVHVGDFDTVQEAWDSASKSKDDFEHGFEVVTVLVKK